MMIDERDDGSDGRLRVPRSSRVAALTSETRRRGAIAISRVSYWIHRPTGRMPKLCAYSYAFVTNVTSTYEGTKQSLGILSLSLSLSGIFGTD